MRILDAIERRVWAFQWNAEDMCICSDKSEALAVSGVARIFGVFVPHAKDGSMTCHSMLD
jgi:hypothetical protein